MNSGSKERPSDGEAIEARAAAWLAQRDDGLTAAQEREFAAWRQADPRHAAAVARLENTWALLQGLRDHAAELSLEPDAFRVTPFPRWGWLPVGVAAAAMLALVATFYTFHLRAPVVAPTVAADPTRVYSTPANGYERDALADGSVVELNANTKVEVSYTPGERRVRLVRGEAHFTVAKNKQRPFWVEARGVAVRAVGTAFNVRIDQGEVNVLVTEGRVRVNQAAQSGAAAVAVPDLGAGEHASISVAGVAIEKVSTEAMREALAWRNGPRLEFAGTALAEVVREFNQHNRVQLELGDPAMGSEPVGGSFQAANVEAFVQLLTSEHDIVAERPSADRIVLRKAR